MNSGEFFSDPVSCIMSGDVLTVAPTQRVAEAAALMASRRVGCAVILDGARVVGIFTERDLLERVAAAGRDPAATPVGEVMTHDPVCVDASQPVGQVWALILERGCRHLPVVMEGRLAGIVSMRDVLQSRLRQVEAKLDTEVRSLREMHDLLSLSSEERTRALLGVNRRLQALALTDDLTGLYNHRYFTQRLAEEVARARRHRAPLALLYADIDHFKLVNDEHGHEAGDRVLRHVAIRLRDGVEGGSAMARLRESDVVARCGGEEFGALLVHARREGALAVADRLRRSVAENAARLEDGTSVPVTISIGLSSLPEDGDGADGLFRAADRALYAAKQAGRNRVVASGPA